MMAIDHLMHGDMSTLTDHLHSGQEFRKKLHRWFWTCVPAGYSPCFLHAKVIWRMRFD